MTEALIRRRRVYKLLIAVVPMLLICMVIWSSVNAKAPASRVIIIGVDAADWDIMIPLIKDGRLPNLQKIGEMGVSSRLETIEVSISPAVWTAISTGVNRLTHGIFGFAVAETEGDPYTSNMRMVPAMWNIVSHYDRRVAIVGHWVSWPAEVVNGEIVSSYISYDPTERDEIYYQGKLRKDNKIPDQTYPPDLIDELMPIITTSEMITREDLQMFVDIDDWDDPDLYLKPDGSDTQIKKHLEYVLPWTIAADRTHIDVFEYLRKTRDPYDLCYTYIEGTDVLGHLFWHCYNQQYLYRALEYWGYDKSVRDKYIEYFGDSLNKYYEWTDEFIGRTMESMGPRDTLIIVSDHGFGKHYHEIGYETEVEMHTFSGSHDRYGVIMFYGANVREGVLLDGPPPNLVDVLPTILTLMKIPVAEWMEGKAITDVFTDEFKASYKTEWVRRYGIEEQFGGGEWIDNPLDPEYLERMRSLGYIQ